MYVDWMQLAAPDFEARLRERLHPQGPFEMMAADFNRAAGCHGVYRGLKDVALRQMAKGELSSVL